MDKITADIKIADNLIATLYAIKNFWGPKHGDEATEIHDKEVPKVNSSYTYLAMMPFDSFLKI